MAAKSFDLVVIGGGPGGYVAAIRAAQLGLKAALVETRATLGGTCLNIGCIPSKALLQSTHLYHAAHDLGDHGIKMGKLGLDLKAMMARKDKIVADTTKGVDFLIKKNKIERFEGSGAITGKGEVTVTKGKKKEKISAKNILIATGSAVASLAGVKIDEKRIVSSTGALELAFVPKTMVVVGAGVIGLELGSVWSRLGAKVTVVEYLDCVLPGMDGEISKQMRRILAKQGMEFKLSAKVTAAKTTKAGVSLRLEPAAGGKSETLDADIVLIAIGRVPYTGGLGLAAAGIGTDRRGFITVAADFRTNVSGVFAIGDVIGGQMLAHKAEDEGAAVAEIVAGQTAHIDYDAIPGVVYTWPEVASLGKTEEQLTKAGITYNTGKFPFSANARARAMGDTDGFVKILADAATDRVLGVHIVGPAAGDLIQEAVMVMEFGGSAEDIARSSHGHPGLSEVVKEAALDVAKRALHI